MQGWKKRSEWNRTGEKARIFGLGLSVAVNLCLLLLCMCTGLSYLSPPPQEKSLVLDFTDERAVVQEMEPAYADEDLDGTPVQKSEAPLEGDGENESDAASVGEKGDVEVPEPEREEPLDEASLFRSPKNRNRDTLSDQTAREVSEALKAGRSDGTSAYGMEDGAPAVKVGRRNARGRLPVPVYAGQESGIVVVDIQVDRNGKVKEARAGGDGTTSALKELWKAAENAAKDTEFNADPSAPELQSGTITYKFLITDGN